MRIAALAVVALGCPAHPVVVDNIATPTLGTSMAVYIGAEPGAAIAVIDDRRRVTVTNGELVLDRIEPAAELPALIVEPLDGSLAIRACSRARADATPAGLEALAQPRSLAKPGRPRTLPILGAGALAPTVRCVADGAPGSYFVRVLQVVPMPSFRVQHQIRYTGGEHAQMITRFTLTTPAWTKQRAQLVVWTGVPGGEVPARALGKGEVTFDGAQAVFANPGIDAPARLRSIYDGAIRAPGQSPTDLAWGHGSQEDVQITLEIDGVVLTSGQVDVHFEGPHQAARDVVVAPHQREQLGATHRLGLGVDGALIGARHNSIEARTHAGGRRIRQQFTLSVTNTTGDSRAVTIEERLRPVNGRQLAGRPAGATITGDILRVDVVIPPHQSERIQFTATYPRL